MATQKNSKKNTRPFKAPLRKVKVMSAKANGYEVVVTFSNRKTDAAKAGIKAGPPSGRPPVNVTENKLAASFKCTSEEHAVALAAHVKNLNACKNKSGLVYQITKLAADEGRLQDARKRAAKQKVYREKIRGEKMEVRRREEARLAAIAKKSERRD
jgi:hypothetical protein